MPRYKETVYQYNKKKVDEKIPSDDLEQSWIQLTEAHNQTANTVLEKDKVNHGYLPAPGKLSKKERKSKGVRLA